MVYISIIELWGEVWEITASEWGVTGLSRACSHVLALENDHTAKAAEELWEYAAGIRRQFTVPLDLAGTSFQKQVWEQLMTIPYGTAVSYSQVARAIGRSKAVRAVARAIGANPCLIFVPCHRVLGKDGSLTGFSAGIDLKERLLQLEKIPYQS